MEQPGPDTVSSDEPIAPRPHRVFPIGCMVAGALLGVLLVVFGTIAVRWVREQVDAPPLLTDAALEAAWKQWEANGPSNYDLDAIAIGIRAGSVHVEVRGGEVTAMTRDGVTPSQRRTWHYWSVDGLLETAELDLAAAGAELMVRAEFDDQFGYPKRYQRIPLDTQPNSGWEVTAFEPRD